MSFRILVALVAVAVAALVLGGCGDHVQAGASSDTGISGSADTATRRPTTTSLLPGDAAAPPTTEPAPSTTTTANEVDPVDTGASASSESPTGPDVSHRAVTAFENWVAAIADGDVKEAWGMLAPTSRKAFGSRERFTELRTDLAEGWGSWVAAEDPSYTVEVDDAGRKLLIVAGTVYPEGMEEDREVGVPYVVRGDRVLLSPFEEFGNVARGLQEPDSDRPSIPDTSGEGRRIVYSNSAQRIWLVEEDGSINDTYLVSGRQGVPAPGTYEVFSKSELAFAGHDDITMTHMVRFAHGTNLPIGFHAIPHDGAGRPIQSEDELGEYRSAGCVRQSQGHAAALYEWAPVGTAVVVLG